MLETYRQTIRYEGVLGLYKGFGTVVMGTIPARAVYLGTLEATKSVVLKVTMKMGVPEATSAGLSNGIAGLVASRLTQTVIVPADVVSQRLMVQDGRGMTHYQNGIHAVREIFHKDGLRGLYRGSGMSILTYGPSSGVWWGSYGMTQRKIWRMLQRDCGHPLCSAGAVEHPHQHLVVTVQAASGLCAGAVSAVVTTPLDVVKTWFQVLENKEGGKPSIAATVRTLMREDGWRGFYRGLIPR
ncbi:hypothetical protein CBR_g52044 [Chara braunii]|uniref:Mitochondrial carrier protein n=1 Tax=Chara braunii TaxID=69332 RepID=A0A388M9K5_CHABU|nr:hypothetical protein CBR_g52044 [Chara braunii]|eukprot:GBG91163.1 hypothetical protein CBR_g52044 [Chara braunii]